MARVATKLTLNKSGGWTARKRIPADIQDDYERLFGMRWEERFNSGPVPFTLAKAKHRDWETAVETRIENIRAERRGGGRTLTPKEAQGLCGQWYDWFIARQGAKHWPAAVWNDLASDVHDALSDAIREASGEPWADDTDPYSVWNENAAAKERARPIVADHAECEQFRHAKGMVLEPASWDMFLDRLIPSFFAAMRLLARNADGDYSPDRWAERFPKFEGAAADPGLTFSKLFERWVLEGPKPERSTVIRWRCVFVKLQRDFPEDTAATLTTDQANEWAQRLVTETRSARTVHGTWANAGRTVFGWAKRRRLITHNPFEEVRITVPRKVRNRETKAFSEAEIRAILGAAQAIGLPKTRTEALRRWVPWLLAYTGARVGEITQLRGSDVIEEQGIAAIKILPEAGTVKTKQARTVPLHAHLIEQGFPAWGHANGKGPLFYEPRTSTEKEDPTKPRRSGPVLARESLARWIRELGVTDKEIGPNHAWRHTFKRISDRHDINYRMINWIVGHTQGSEGDKYGGPTLRDKAEALRKFPPYEV